MVELFTYGFDAMWAGDRSPVFLELNARVRRSKYATLQLAVLMQMKHLVFERLQECWWICTEYCLRCGFSLSLRFSLSWKSYFQLYSPVSPVLGHWGTRWWRQIYDRKWKCGRFASAIKNIQYSRYYTNNSVIVDLAIGQIFWLFYVPSSTLSGISVPGELRRRGIMWLF